MTVRTGKEYLAGLAAHPREVWAGGKRIYDVDKSPLFRGPIETLAGLYDLQHAPEHRETMICKSPETGEAMGFSFLRPTTHEDLVQRRKGSRIWAEASYGMLGRSPDFLNTTVMTFADNAHFFAKQGAQFGDHISSFYTHCKTNDVFMTHALIPPQNDRSKASSEQEDPYMHLGIVKQTEDGLIVRGAKMLATHSPIADELMVYPSGVLKPGDERYALAFAIPSGTEGIRYICREPFENAAVPSWDHPLSTRFEEPDAVVIFDDVLIPWHRVFLHGDIKLANEMANATNQRYFSGHQTAVRGLAKVKFMTGLAIALTRSVKSDIFLHVQEQLGECLGYLSLIEGAILLSEQNAERTATGILRPAPEPLQAIRYHLPKFYERAVQVTQVLGAGGLLLNPTEADLNSEIGPDIARFYKGAGIDAKSRIRISKLAWDATGTQFGQRMVQYERYYGGDPVRVGAGNYLAYPCDDILDYVRSAFVEEKSLPAHLDTKLVKPAP